MQETAVRFAICDDDKTYAEKMKALILQTFQLPQPVECVIYLNQEQILVKIKLILFLWISSLAMS